MNYNLFGYNINGSSGSTIGIDIVNCPIPWLNGNDAWVISSGQTLSGYTNITSIVNMNKFGPNAINTYQTQQKGVRLCGYETGWSAMTDTEKDIIIDWYAYPEGSTEIITYLVITKGMTQDEAESYLIDKWHIYWNSFLGDCPKRWSNAAKVTIDYLPFSGASQLMDTVNVLVDKYLVAGRLGVGYGDTSDGLMNFVMSSNGYVGNGLEEYCTSQGFTLKKGDYDAFRNDLQNTIIDPYFWSEIEQYI
jgi:hypothetical protein